MVLVLVLKEGHCPACMMTKKLLGQLGVSYDLVPVDVDSDVFLRVNEATGFRQMPIVLPKGEEDYSLAFSGFQPDKLRGLVYEGSD